MIESVPAVRVDTLGGHRISSTGADGAEPSPAFGDSVGSVLNGLGAAESRADAAAIDGATGDLASVSDYMVAATEAQLVAEVTVAVRNRAIEAFNDIMRMQV